MSTLSTPPALLEAVQLSEETWQSDLHDLFEQAKDRFPDILWERDEDDDDTKGPAEVWGHKGTSEVPCVSAKARIFTVSYKPSCMLVLLRHGKQNTFNSVPRPSVPQLPTQLHLVSWVFRARYRSI